MHVQVHILLMNLFHKKKICLKDSYTPTCLQMIAGVIMSVTLITHLMEAIMIFLWNVISTFITIFFMGHDVFFQLSRMALFTYVVQWLYMINLGIVTIVIMAMLKCLQTLVLWQCVLGHYTVLLMFSKA